MAKTVVSCPQCGQSLFVPADYTGTAGCPKCMNKVDLFEGRTDTSSTENLHDVLLSNNTPQTLVSPFSMSAYLFAAYLVAMGGLFLFISPIFGLEFSIGIGTVFTFLYMVLGIIVYFFEQ